MKAMILAAGRGERMRPLTDTTPKPLLKAGGHCLIEYHILALKAAGVTSLVINHAHLGDQIERALGDGASYGVSIRYSVEKQALETAGGIQQALPLLGDEPFIVVNGDVWTDYPFDHLVNYRGESLAHLVMVDNPEHNPNGDFALTDDGLLHEAGESKLTFSGIGLYNPRLFADLAPGKAPLAPLLREAMSRGQVSGEYYSGQWWDIGTPERLRDLDERLKLKS